MSSEKASEEMGYSDELRLVVKLACLTEDRTKREQEALLRIAKLVERSSEEEPYGVSLVSIVNRTWENRTK